MFVDSVFVFSSPHRRELQDLFHTLYHDLLAVTFRRVVKKHVSWKFLREKITYQENGRDFPFVLCEGTVKMETKLCNNLTTNAAPRRKSKPEHFKNSQRLLAFIPIPRLLFSEASHFILLIHLFSRKNIAYLSICMYHIYS